MLWHNGVDDHIGVFIKEINTIFSDKSMHVLSITGSLKLEVVSIPACYIQIETSAVSSCSGGMSGPGLNVSVLPLYPGSMPPSEGSYTAANNLQLDDLLHTPC